MNILFGYLQCHLRPNFEGIRIDVIYIQNPSP
ncbi:hypothetical protein LINPERHAP1_LOCUS28414 [Linum perenne]